jgi:hypothetical protein
VVLRRRAADGDVRLPHRCPRGTRSAARTLPRSYRRPAGQAQLVSARGCCGQRVRIRSHEEQARPLRGGDLRRRACRNRHRVRHRHLPPRRTTDRATRCPLQHASRVPACRGCSGETGSPARPAPSSQHGSAPSSAPRLISSSSSVSHRWVTPSGRPERWSVCSSAIPASGYSPIQLLGRPLASAVLTGWSASVTTWQEAGEQMTTLAADVHAFLHEREPPWGLTTVLRSAAGSAAGHLSRYTWLPAPRVPRLPGASSIRRCIARRCSRMMREHRRATLCRSTGICSTSVEASLVRDGAA